jgi:hypothetical protein
VVESGATNSFSVLVLGEASCNACLPVQIFTQRICYMDASKECQILVSDIFSATAVHDVLVINLNKEENASSGCAHSP